MRRSLVFLAFLFLLSGFALGAPPAKESVCDDGIDNDGDGSVDVVSSCEGSTRTVFVHWAPKEPAAYLDPSAWEMEPIPASQNVMMWMFCTPLQVDGRHGVDLEHVYSHLEVILTL